MRWIPEVTRAAIGGQHEFSEVGSNLSQYLSQNSRSFRRRRARLIQLVLDSSIWQQSGASSNRHIVVCSFTSPKLDSVDSVDSVVNRLSNNKACEVDGLPTNTRRYLYLWIANVCLQKLNTKQDQPHSLLEGICAKGDSSSLANSNSRPCSLLNACYKMFAAWSW